MTVVYIFYLTHFHCLSADLGAGGENVKVLSRRVFEQEWSGSVAKTELIKVGVERGLSWDRAMDIWRDHVGSDDGFYTSTTVSEVIRSSYVLSHYKLYRH